MIYGYLRRGVASGALAGLAYGLYMVFVGHPLSGYIDGAGRTHDHDAPATEHGGHVVSETTTAVVSAGSGLLWAIFLGGVFALALYFLEPALPGSERIKPYVLAGAGFLTVSAVPWLVLPPAAPGASYAYTADSRLQLYLALVFIGAVTVAAALIAYNRGRRRHAGVGILAAAVPILAVAAVLTLSAPTITTHPELPADLVSVYRALAVLSQAAVWLLIAGTFNALRRRASGFGDEPTAPDADALAG